MGDACYGVRYEFREILRTCAWFYPVGSNLLTIIDEEIDNDSDMDNDSDSDMDYESDNDNDSDKGNENDLD